MQLVLAVVVGMTLGVAGFAMLGFFQANPALLPEGFTLRTDADMVFPRFIAFHLPPVVSGLVASGLLAAAMSSMDSGVNSISAVVTTDFLDRFAGRRIDESAHVRLARWVAVAVGVLVVLGSSVVDLVPGNILAVANKTVNLFAVPIFCLFYFALFVEKASTRGVWVGCVVGTLTAISIAFSGPILTFLVETFGVDAHSFGVEMTTTIDQSTGVISRHAPDPISFQWIGPAALIVNLAVGWAASRLWPDPKADFVRSE
jgi:SSS family solute:Na+ symporter